MRALLLLFTFFITACQVESPIDLKAKIVNENAFAYSTEDILLYVGGGNISLAPIITGSKFSYTISPSLPPGINLNSNSGVITGVPVNAQSKTLYTITASSSTKIKVASIRIEILDEPVSSVTLSSSSVTAYMGSTNVNVSVLSMAGGTPDNFTINPSLPAGLFISPTTGAISGISTECKNLTNYSVVASNSGGSYSVPFSLEVLRLNSLSINYPNNDILTFTQNQFSSATPNVTESPLNNVVAGVYYTYSLLNTTSLQGLNFNNTTGSISGFPTTVTSLPMKILVTATETATNCSTSKTVTISINVQNSISYQQGSDNKLYLLENFPMKNGTPSYTPSNIGGLINVTSNIPLPTGLVLSNTTGEITGTPTITSPNLMYGVLNATPLNGALSVLPTTLRIEVGNSFSYDLSSYPTMRAGEEFSIKPNLDDVQVAEFAITSGSLPAGVSFNDETGVISGTPQAYHNSAIIVEARNNACTPNTDCPTASFTLDIKDYAIGVVAYNTPNPVYTCNQQIQTNYPVITSGSTSLNYNILMPATLPAGLSLNPTTGQITGSPTVPSTTQLIPIEITNASSGVFIYPLNITVNPELPDFTYPDIFLTTAGSSTYNPTLNHCALNESFSINPVLPTGITLDPVSGEFEANTSKVISRNKYTVSVTNATGVTNKDLTIQVDYKETDTDYEIVYSDMMFFDADQFADLVIIEKKCPLLCTSAKIKVFKGEQNKVYSPLYTLDLANIANAPVYFDIDHVSVTDIDGDGYQDLLFIEKYSHKAFILKSTQDTAASPRKFVTYHVLDAPISANRIIAADLNYELPREVLITDNSHKLYMYQYVATQAAYVRTEKHFNSVAGQLADGSPSYDQGEVNFNVLGVNSMQDIEVAALDWDEYPDLIITDKQNNRICIILGEEGTFNFGGISNFADSCITAIKTPSTPQKVVLADLNFDGLQDILVQTTNGHIYGYANDDEYFTGYNQLNPEKMYTNTTLNGLTNFFFEYIDVNMDGVGDLVLHDGDNDKLIYLEASLQAASFNTPVEILLPGIDYIKPAFNSNTANVSIITCDKSQNTCGISHHTDAQIVVAP